MRSWRFLLLAFGLMMGLCPSRAERFISISQAQQLCFTNATRFEEVTLRLSRDQIKAIESEARVKVRNSTPRLWRAWANHELLGTVWFDQVIGKHEFIDYVVALAPGGEVKTVEIVEYREHYGGDVRNPRWLDQFRGKTVSAPIKLGTDIYNISGATMSCRHVTEGIKRVLATFQQVHDRIGSDRFDRVPSNP